jgi:ABC-type polysaccharide/polyol phosphate export permease
LYFGINPGWVCLLVIPALLLVLLNLMALGVALSLFGLRFRDVQPIIQSMIQVLFFITPITWFPKLLAADSWVMQVNPFAYYLDLLRSPMLGNAPNLISWAIVVGALLVFSGAAVVVYKAKASRIPFWV